METLTSCVTPIKFDSGNTTTLTSGTTNSISYWPYANYYYTYNPTHQLQIRQAKNGFIVSENNEEFVFSTISLMNKFIEKRYEKK